MAKSWLEKKAEEAIAACDNEAIYAYKDDDRLTASIVSIARAFAERALQHGLYGKLLEVPYGDAPIADAIKAAEEQE